MDGALGMRGRSDFSIAICVAFSLSLLGCWAGEGGPKAAVYRSSMRRALDWKLNEEEKHFLAIMLKSNAPTFAEVMMSRDMKPRHHLFFAKAPLPVEEVTREVRWRQKAAHAFLPLGTHLIDFLVWIIDDPQSSPRLRAEALMMGSGCFLAVRDAPVMEPFLKRAWNNVAARDFALRDAAYKAVATLTPRQSQAATRVRQLLLGERDPYLRDSLARWAMCGGHRFGLIEHVRVACALHKELPEVLGPASDWRELVLPEAPEEVGANWETLLKWLTAHVDRLEPRAPGALEWRLHDRQRPPAQR